MTELKNMTGLEAVRKARRLLAEQRRAPWFDRLRAVDTRPDDELVEGSARLVVGMAAMLGSVDAWWADTEQSLEDIEQSGSSALGALLNLTGGGRHADAIQAARRFVAGMRS